MRTPYKMCAGCLCTIWERPYKVTDAPVFKYWHRRCWFEHEEKKHAEGSPAEPVSKKGRVAQS